MSRVPGFVRIFDLASLPPQLSFPVFLGMVAVSSPFCPAESLGYSSPSSPTPSFLFPQSICRYLAKLFLAFFFFVMRGPLAGLGPSPQPGWTVPFFLFLLDTPFFVLIFYHGRCNFLFFVFALLLHPSEIFVACLLDSVVLRGIFAETEILSKLSFSL